MRLLPIDEHSTPSATLGHNRTSTIISDNNSFVSFPKSASRQSLRRRALSAAHSYREQGNARSMSYGPSDLDQDLDLESFHRLPRISGVSSLKVPSILELPSSCISFRSSQSGNLGTIPKLANKKRSFGTLNIPSLMHPNSPYVPWSPPLREKILRPLSQEFGEYNRHTSPGDPSAKFSLPHNTPVELKGTKNVFRRLLSGTLRKAKRVTQYRARKDLPDRRLIKQDESQTETPFGPPPIYNVSRRFSVTSVRSSETNTLSIWLAERRQLLDIELDFTPIDEHFSHLHIVI
ncbi:hypothetical protein BDQ17DRAFT_1340893 [Cyathus striatus]|nr:hypothetical protein BDQ17DRAFT_1340893 [Cyathus striatus]